MSSLRHPQAASVLLLACTGLATAAPPVATVSTALAPGAYLHAEKYLLLTVAADPLSLTLEVPDSLSKDASARKTLHCEKPAVAKDGAVTCTVQWPLGPRSEAMTFQFYQTDADHVSFGPVGVSNLQVLSRVDTTDPAWRSSIKQDWGAVVERASTGSNVDGLRIAEIAYYAAFNTYVPAEFAPRLLSALDASAVDWVGNPGFDALMWRPDGDVAATFGVTVSTGADGQSHFLVEAWLDADGDGVPAHWTATETELAKQISAAGVR